jgi:hypothetical protein
MDNFKEFANLGAFGVQSYILWKLISEFIPALSKLTEAVAVVAELVRNCDKSIKL